MIWFSVRQKTSYVFGPRQVNRDPGFLKFILGLGMAIYKSILPADEEIIGSS
jgi:hypothetical protein